MNYQFSDGACAGAVVVDSKALVSTRVRASISGADRGLLFASAVMLDEASAGQMPDDLRGRLLLPDELGKLERTIARKKDKP